MYTKDEYLLNYSDEFILSKMQEAVIDLDIELVDFEIKGAITGNVVDENGEPIVGATVKIFDLNFNPIKHTMTDLYGEYSITNVLEGDYLIYAIKDGYNLSIKRAVNVTNLLVRIEPITIKKIFNENKNLVYGITYNMAKERLSRIKVKLVSYDSKAVIYETLSADDGEFVLYGVPNGTYYLEAQNEDYILTKAIEVYVDGSIPVKEDLFLSSNSVEKEGTINGIIRDKETSVPISDCLVFLFEIDELGNENLINTTITDREGKYLFGHVGQGYYIVKAKKSS